MTTQVSVDIETLATAENAVVLSIGAVKFNETEMLDQTPFYTVLNPQEQIDSGRSVSASTIVWWHGQNQRARDAAFSAVREGTRQGVVAEPVVQSLRRFAEWYGPDNSLPIWAKPATFDITILNNLFRQHGWHTPPWSYRATRCMSTLMRLFPKVKRTVDAPVAHHALDDAIEQAMHIRLLLNHIKDKQ